MIRRLFRLGLLVGVAAAVYLGFTFVQVVQASRRADAQPADAIVVLGAAQYNGAPSPVLRSRLDHAVDLYQRGLAPVVVVTGGGQPGDLVTEASAGRRYLISEGIPDDALRSEVQGTSSWQSLAAAARFLTEEGVDEVILVSSPYHALRTEHIAGEVGLDGRASPAPRSPETGPLEIARMGRETLAVGLGRIIGHRRLVNLDERVGQVRSEVGAR
ncbi:MAG TPA: YdcF family protein [Acidimicrobiales bacterium]|nr:YdcF family protein [Acidimicrobiales bacterium]